MAYKIGQVINASEESSIIISGVTIYQLGIQAPSGSTITLNDLNKAEAKITMGRIGVFEIPANLGIALYSAKVELPTGTAVGGELIIDYLYEENTTSGGGTQ